MRKNLLFIISFFGSIAFSQTNIPNAVKDAASCLVNLNLASDTILTPIFRTSLYQADFVGYGDPMGQQNGVAFLVSDKSSQSNYLVTAAHVIATNGKTQINKNNNNIVLETGDWIWDSQKDIAICEVKAQKLPTGLRPISFSELANFQLGENTYIPGDTSVSRGILQNIDANSNDNIAAYHLLQCSNYVNKGQSGSPILNEKGQMMGILLRKNSEGGCFALDRKTFVELFYQLQKEGKARRFYTGIVFDINPESKQLIIKDYIPNSPAAQSDASGQYINRNLFSINSQEVHNFQDIHKIMEDLPDESMILFLKFSDGTRLSIKASASGNKEQAEITDYFFEKFVREPTKKPPIILVQIKEEGRSKYKYEIREKSQLGAIIRTFSWNNQLIFWDKEANNYSAMDEKRISPRKILIF